MSFHENQILVVVYFDLVLVKELVDGLVFELAFYYGDFLVFTLLQVFHKLAFLDVYHRLLVQFLLALASYVYLARCLFIALYYILHNGVVIEFYQLAVKYLQKTVVVNKLVQAE